MAFAGGIVATAGPAIAAGCAFQPQGEGRVAAIIDARSFRLEDGREVRLAGIEPVGAEKSRRPRRWRRSSAGREVTLARRGRRARPLRPPVRLRVCRRSETPVQAQLLAQGAALASGTVTDKDCAAVLAAAEAAARDAKQASGTILRP